MSSTHIVDTTWGASYIDLPSIPESALRTDNLVHVLARALITHANGAGTRDVLPYRIVRRRWTGRESQHLREHDTVSCDDVWWQPSVPIATTLTQRVGIVVLERVWEVTQSPTRLYVRGFISGDRLAQAILFPHDFISRACVTPPRTPELVMSDAPPPPPRIDDETSVNVAPPDPRPLWQQCVDDAPVYRYDGHAPRCAVQMWWFEREVTAHVARLLGRRRRSDPTESAESRERQGAVVCTLLTLFALDRELVAWYVAAVCEHTRRALLRHAAPLCLRDEALFSSVVKYVDTEVVEPMRALMLEDACGRAHAHVTEALDALPPCIVQVATAAMREISVERHIGV